MGNKDRFTSVWDAIEDDPVRQENLKMRSALMIEIAERIKEEGLTQKQAAAILHPAAGQCPSAWKDQRVSSGQPGRYGAPAGPARFDQRRRLVEGKSFGMNCRSASGKNGSLDSRAGCAGCTTHRTGAPRITS